MEELFNEIKMRLEEHPGSNSSRILANAMASACNNCYGVSLLDCSIGLDNESKHYILKLANVRNLPGYSNAVQDETLLWLTKRGFIEKVS